MVANFTYLLNARKKLKWLTRVGILCDGCDGKRRKMVLTVLCFFLFIKYVYEVLGGLCEWVEVWKKESIFVPTVWEDFRFFYLGGCFVMDMWWWLIFRGDKEGIFLMFCCRQWLVLVSPRWLWERCLCLLVAICTKIRRWWMRRSYI